MRIFSYFFILCCLSSTAYAVNCTGRFVNPITDICWECLFPMSIGGVPVVPSPKVDPPNPSSPICVCPTPIPRIGITAGFWEPYRLVDVTKRPFCFVSLGGIDIAPALPIGAGDADGATEEVQFASWQVHWYIYPIVFWLNLILDFLCLEVGGFDVAYITEIDPTWQSDELAFILNPEALLFANPIAQAACVVDCVTASFGLPLDPLFWCAGCQGSLYPLSGNITGHNSSMQSSLLAAERLTYKLHRQLLLWGSIGDAGLCGRYPMPIMRKSQYKSQLTIPIPNVLGPFTCNSYGRSSIFYDFGKEIPVIGEDFGYLIWRKKNCCVL